MIPFVGPSYNLGKESPQRSVNLYLSAMETPGKAQYVLRSAPGLTLLAGGVGVTRGTINAAGRMFAVFGTGLYEISSAGVLTLRGSLSTSSGRVGMEYGLLQLTIVDGANGYVLTLSSNAFAAIVDVDWPGADAVGYLDGFFTLTRATNQQHYVTAIDNAASIDALDFASAESRPDKIVGHVVSNREVLYFGETTTERWFNAGNADYPFSRDASANSEVGCVAGGSIARIDNGVIWLGRDRNGGGYVYRDIERQPQRISTIAVERALQASSDLSGAVAFTFQMGGHSFYCLNAPGVASTWVYELATQSWCEFADLDLFGEFEAWRVTHACYCYDTHYAFDAIGNVYTISESVDTFAGDEIRRSRISPNDVTPSLERQFYSSFTLDCTTGEAPQGVSPIVELSWSNDGGKTWGDPVQRSLGAVGNYYPRIVWNRLGAGRDRVWRVDCASPVPFTIVNGQAVKS